MRAHRQVERAALGAFRVIQRQPGGPPQLLTRTADPEMPWHAAHRGPWQRAARPAPVSCSAADDPRRYGGWGLPQEERCHGGRRDEGRARSGGAPLRGHCRGRLGGTRRGSSPKSSPIPTRRARPRTSPPGSRGSKKGAAGAVEHDRLTVRGYGDVALLSAVPSTGMPSRSAATRTTARPSTCCRSGSAGPRLQIVAQHRGDKLPGAS